MAATIGAVVAIAGGVAALTKTGFEIAGQITEQRRGSQFGGGGGGGISQGQGAAGGGGGVSGLLGGLEGLATGLGTLFGVGEPAVQQLPPGAANLPGGVLAQGTPEFEIEQARAAAELIRARPEVGGDFIGPITSETQAVRDAVAQNIAQGEATRRSVPGVARPDPAGTEGGFDIFKEVDQFLGLFADVTGALGQGEAARTLLGQPQVPVGIPQRQLQFPGPPLGAINRLFEQVGSGAQQQVRF